MQTLNNSIHLSPVYRNRIFHSSEKVATHDHVSRELADHQLQWRNGNPDTAMFKARINQLKLFVLRYGAEVEVRTRPFDDFALVHTSMRSGAEIECDGQVLHVKQGAVAVIAPRKSIRLRWEEGSEQLILKVPYSLLQDLRPHATRYEPPARLQSGLLQSPACQMQWGLLLQSLLTIAAQPQDNTMSAEWTDHFERSVALFLLTQQGHAAASCKQQDGAPHHSTIAELPACGAAPRMEALEHYMRTKLCAPVQLADLAQAAGVSVRTLNMLCHRFHGVSPMDLLRNMRLDAAHAALRAKPHVSVTETALQYGFGHLGRFSAYYRQRFGQLPKYTLGSSSDCQIRTAAV